MTAPLGRKLCVVLPPDEFARLWDQHADRLLLIARGIGEPAEDAVQEAFLRLAEQSQAPQETFAWLVQVVRNQLYQWWRSDQRRQRRNMECSMSRNWFSEGQLDDRCDAEIVSKALQGLPEEKRSVVMMHIWGEMTFSQIANVLGASQSSVHRRYQSAMDDLKVLFEDSQRTKDSNHVQ